MSTPVSLKNIAGEMQLVSDDVHLYLNKTSGELVPVTRDEIDTLENGDDWDDEPEWRQEVLQETKQVLESDDYLEFPSQFEIHEYDMMERFCLSVKDQRTSDDLLDLIRGSGAFRRFKNAVIRYGIEQDWYRFKERAYAEIAIGWLEKNGIAYINDLDGGNAA